MMNKKLIVPILTLIVIIIAIITTVILVSKKETETMKNTQSANLTDDVKNNRTEGVEMNKFFLSTNGMKFEVVPEDNAATHALLEKLAEGDIVIEAEEYGGFEKIGELGFSLPTSDERITTKPGDLLLYNGDQISLFYGENTWNYTKLGKVNATQDELTRVLGGGDVEIVLSWK